MILYLEFEMESQEINMKKYYALIASILAMLAGATSCGEDPPIYGTVDSEYVDEDNYENISVDEVQNNDEDLN